MPISVANGTAVALSAANTSEAMTVVAPAANTTLALAWDYAGTNSGQGILSLVQTGVTWRKAGSYSDGNVYGEIWIGVVGASPGGTALTVNTAISKATTQIRGSYLEIAGVYGTLAYHHDTLFGNSLLLASPTLAPVATKNGIMLAYSRMGLPSPTYSSGPSNSFTAVASGSGFCRLSYRIVNGFSGTYATTITFTGSSGAWGGGALVLYDTALPTTPALKYNTQPVDTVTGATMADVVVGVTTDGTTIDTAYTGPVSLRIATGTGWLNKGATSHVVTVNAVAGVATFSGMKLYGGGTHSLVADASGYASVTSNVFTMNAGAVAGSYVTIPCVVAGVTYTDQRVWIPGAYDGSKAWPVFVVGHGGGEQGNNDGTLPNIGSTYGGIPTQINANPNSWSVITICPRIPAGSANRYDYYDIVIACIDWVRANYSCDDNRIALTGLSFSGTLYYELLSYLKWTIRRDIFSCYMPTPGVIPLSNQNAIRPVVPFTAQGAADTFQSDFPNLNLWSLQSDADTSMPPSATVTTFNSYNGKDPNFKWTEYTTQIHTDVWPATYSSATSIRWLIDQTKQYFVAGLAGLGGSRRRRRL